MKRSSKFLMAVLGVLGFAVFYSGLVFAEGDILCSGRITGTTTLSNANAGKVSFDAHEAPAGPKPPAEDGIAADLSIVLGAGINGLAPANRENAACVDDEPGVFDGSVYDFKVKGWAWNTNGGFTSFSCENGVNDAGEGAGTACGNINYGTYVRPVGDDGSRQLFGYAWNPIFGWIQMRGKGTAPLVSGVVQLDVGESVGVVLGGQMYEVFLQGNNPIGESTIGVNGPTQVLTVGQKGQYGNVFLEVLDMEYFEGPSPHLTFRLETVAGSDFTYGVQVDPNGVSSGYAWTQAGIYVNFAGLKFHFPGDAANQQAQPPAPAIGDWCSDKTFICLEADPDPTGLQFGADFEGAPQIADGQHGYNIHLYMRDKNGNALDPANYQLDPFLASIKLNWKDTVKINQLFSDPINQVGNALENIRNPWSEADAVGAVVVKPLVFTDFSEIPAEPGHFISEKIKSFAPTTDSKLSATTATKPAFYTKNEDFLYDLGLGKMEPNELTLKSITYGDLKDAAGKIVLNQGVVYPNGRPGMAFKFRPAMLVNTLYANDLQDTILAYRSIPMNFRVGTDIIGNFAQSVVDSGMVYFVLGYSKEETALQDACQGGNVVKDFIFAFVSDLVGNDISANPKPSLSRRLSQMMMPGGVDVQAVASLIDYTGNDPNVLPCDTAQGANLYTKIEYLIDAGHKKVAYYDNKLPRVAGNAILNPVLVVHGNIFTQGSSSVRADERVQTSGSVNAGMIRDTINENLEKNVGDTSIRQNGKCSVVGLGAVPTVNNCAGYYETFAIGDEKILYFNHSDVYLNLAGGAWTGKWVVITDGGDIFFDGNAYNAVPGDNRLSAVALRSNGNDYFSTGNVYIAPCSNNVKNIQATIIADGSVFSYSGNKADIDAENGEPVWGSYVEMTNALACQLLLDGAIYSDNTIGGANLDQGQNPKDYILAGGGKVIGGPGKTIKLVDRMKAQFYDLNYLRMFRLALKSSVSGLPVDLKCDKPWTAEDQAKISQGLTVCGEKNPCDPLGQPSQQFACDGINPLLKYNAAATPDGDLTVPQDQNALAKGLNNSINTGTDFDPVYVFYNPPEKTSFIFSQAGAVDIGGN